MAKSKVSDQDFIDLFKTIGPKGVAERFGIAERGVYRRRERLEARMGIQITAPEGTGHRTRYDIQHEARHKIALKDGVVLVGSDAHYWPGVVSTAHRAFVHFAKKLKPDVIVMNGDVLDGASISRHPSIGWESKPSLIEEIETCDERLAEIQKAAPNAKRIWTLGNHDARFESRLANVAPEYARVHGVHLKDHFPYWEPCWSVWINDDVVIKHRWKGGTHATHNNTVNSGKSIVTGHLHSLKVTPWTDYTGTRYGVDTGTLAAPFGPQFIDYTEDGPVNWRSGFAVLTFRDGRLMWPEVVHVLSDTEVEYQAKVHTV